MLIGGQITLRPVRADDIGPLHDSSLDLENRGLWYPVPTTPLAKFEADFADSGFWTAGDGIFAIVDRRDRLVGIVGWEELNGDVADIEVSQRLFDQADRGKGIVTEALGLLVGWLFDTGHANRLQASVHVDNKASRRVAEKCGFSYEGTSRAGWYNRGQWHDIAVYTVTRAEFEDQRLAVATPA